MDGGAERSGDAVLYEGKIAVAQTSEVDVYDSSLLSTNPTHRIIHVSSRCKPYITVHILLLLKNDEMRKYS